MGETPKTAPVRFFQLPYSKSYTIMSHPNLLEYHLLSRCSLVDGSPSVVRTFTDCFRAPHDTGITLKFFYSIIHRCYSVTALCFTWFSLPNFLASYASFSVLGFNSIEPFTTAHREDSNYSHYSFFLLEGLSLEETSRVYKRSSSSFFLNLTRVYWNGCKRSNEHEMKKLFLD
jgi:hypothetical protein